MSFKYLLMILPVLYCVHCENANENHTNAISNEQPPTLRKGREIGSYIGLISCAMKYDVNCIVNAAEDYLEIQRTELLAQADAEVLRSTGRSDPESRPSYMAKTLTKLISEFVNMFQNGMSGMFSAGREAGDDDDDDETLEENELTDKATSDSNGVGRASKSVSRKHKKKEGLIIKIIRVVKYGIYALVFFLKLLAVILMFNSFVNFKMLLVTMWGVAFLAAKVWLMFKQGDEHVIVHEDVHHDHHYENDHHFDHLPVEDWHRNYVPKETQNMVYRGQKPTSSSLTSWLD